MRDVDLASAHPNPWVEISVFILSRKAFFKEKEEGALQLCMGCLLIMRVTRGEWECGCDKAVVRAWEEAS